MRVAYLCEFPTLLGGERSLLVFLDAARRSTIDPVVVAGDPEQSYMMIGLSLLLPYLEPYLIRTMKEAKKQISDPELIDDLERFSAQEGRKRLSTELERKSRTKGSHKDMGRCPSETRDARSL